MSAIYESDCPECDGDGYQERFNDEQDGVITWLCPACDGTGKRRRGGDDAMTPDELRALADAWDALCEKTGVDPSNTPGPLARDHADLREWAERAAEALRDPSSQLVGRTALLAEYAERWGDT